MLDINSIRTIAFDASDLIVSIFNKEGIAIFCLFSVIVFALATMAATWAYDNGEFQDIEGAKFEMLED